MPVLACIMYVPAESYEIFRQVRKAERMFNHRHKFFYVLVHHQQIITFCKWLWCPETYGFLCVRFRNSGHAMDADFLCARFNQNGFSMQAFQQAFLLKNLYWICSTKMPHLMCSPDCNYWRNCFGSIFGLLAFNSLDYFWKSLVCLVH